MVKHIWLMNSVRCILKLKELRPCFKLRYIEFQIIHAEQWNNV